MPTPIDFSLYPLDKLFVASKPREGVEEQILLDLDNSGNLIKQRKRNGHASFISVTEDGRRVDIYSRGINDITEKLPSIVDEVRSLNFPNGTLLAGELRIEKNGNDDLGAFSGIIRSTTPKSIELQKKTPVKLSVYNVLARGGNIIVDLPYKDRLAIIHEQFHQHSGGNVSEIDVLDMSLVQAREVSVSKEWEGLVLYDANASTLIARDSRQDYPPRPYGCWKWKSYNESDFVATGWVPSTAKNNLGLVKDLIIAQRNPKTGQLVHWGKVGIGLSAKQRKEYTDNSLYPMVFEIKFETRTPNNRLINAQILRRRFDKNPNECFSPD